jgi:hypothetical protein
MSTTFFVVYLAQGGAKIQGSELNSREKFFASEVGHCIKALSDKIAF